MPTEVLNLKLPNGEIVTAPAGIMLIALIDVMDPRLKEDMLRRVIEIKTEHEKNNTIYNAYAPVPDLGIRITPPREQISLGPQADRVGPREVNGTEQPHEYLGMLAHTDFTVDRAGKKHYTMHCDTGNYAGLLFPNRNKKEGGK